MGLGRTERGPFESGAVRVGRIGCSQNCDFDLIWRVAQRAEEVHGTWQRELRRTKAGHEIASTHTSTLFHRFQYWIHTAESTGNLLACQ